MRHRKNRFRAFLKTPEKPYLHQEAIEYLQGLLQPQFRIFEFGAGHSTIWFARRVAHVESVEARQDWYELLSDQIRELGLSNVMLRYFPLTSGKRGEYTDHILTFPDNWFDLIFVDGLSRNVCVNNSKAKVCPGGTLVVDDSQWARLRPSKILLKDWPVVIVPGRILRDGGKVINKTTHFFTRPSE